MRTTETDAVHDDDLARWDQDCGTQPDDHASAIAPAPAAQRGPTTIRAATLADVDTIVAMGLRFQATTSYAAHLRATAATLRTLAIGLVTNTDAAVILLLEDGAQVVGMLAASLYVHPMSAEIIGTEVCWWVEPAARGGRGALRLVRAAEAWARDRGAVVMQMMAPAGGDADVGRFYEVLHYAPIETHYQRRL